MKKTRVGIVNYLNTKPLIYGLEREPISRQIDLIGDYPARLAARLMSDDIDIGLVPVAVIPKLSSSFVIGDYCIGTEGEIASVALFSEVPMHEIETVYLDYQSRTSAALLKYLMKDFWGIKPLVIESVNEDYRNKIMGTTAGLVIGDRALEQRKVSTYIYDLGSEWRALTSLPFVFAAWISKKEFSPEFVQMFNQGNEMGLHHLDEITAGLNTDLYDMKKYYSLHLSYHLDTAKRKSMELFLDVIKEF